ncbi:MAG: hypothetical protein ACFFCL_09510 [Promethearchaeota archaeon]
MIDRKITHLIIMKYIKNLASISSIILFLILLIPRINANPVYPTTHDLSGAFLIICTFGFFGTVLCEYGIGYFMIHKARENKSPIFKIIFSVNAITYPITQIFVYFFTLITLPNYLGYVILLIEVVVIASEWFLITLFFKKRNEIYHLGEYNSKSYLFIYSSIANMATYLIGLLVVFIWGGFGGIIISFF